MSDFTIADAMALLSGRTVFTWKVAHLLLDREGVYTCLDLNFTAPDLATVKRLIVEMATALGSEAVLPIAEQSLWERFVAAPFLPPPECFCDLSQRGLSRSHQLTIVVRRES